MPMRYLPLATLLVAPAAAHDLVVVDPLGAPVADLPLMLDRSPLGLIGATPHNFVLTTGEDGRVSIPEGATNVLDVTSADEDWAVSFVHAPLVRDALGMADVTGRPLHYLDLSQDCVCVVARTGTIELAIDGARAEDIFHVCFLDERPEPDSHRQVRRMATFGGTSASLRVPSGRGHLWIARDGELGSLVSGPRGPLLVQASAGGTSRVRVTTTKGPETLVLAPFSTIPFERVEALAPDGETQVASMPFETSPLVLPSTAFTAAGVESSARVAGRHLLRAGGVQLQPTYASTEEDDSGDVERMLEAPSVELLFSIDVGGKLRLPEVESGWVHLAQRGAMDLAGAAMLPRAASRPAIGHVNLTPDAEGGWSATLHATTTGDTPAAHREVLLALDGPGPVRAVTDAEGHLHIEGIATDRIAVAPLGDPARTVEVDRPEGHATPEVHLALPGRAPRVHGQWAGPGNRPALLTLVPGGETDQARWVAFGTRAIHVAALDSEGRFDFGPVPSGTWALATDDGTATECVIEPDAATVELRVRRDGAGRLATD